VKSLYVTDREAVGDARWLEILASLASSASSAAFVDSPGAVAVQLREKRATDREALARAIQAKSTLGPSVPLWVNRRFDVATAAGAHGVHLPADGLPVPRVRANAPRGLSVGVSTHSAAEVERAIEEGADLVVFGPVFATPSKEGMGSPLGPSALEKLPPSSAHGADVFVIGGISESNVRELLPWRDRIAGVAAIRMFQDAEDPGRVAERLAAL
jgi:thiamine-phosphate diphosphorylase